MRIRTQFIISTAIFAVLLLTISASVMLTNREVVRLDEQGEIAVNIERGASELIYLSNDYLLHGESQLRTRWESMFASFSDDVSRLNPDTPEQQALVDNIKRSQQRLKAVFTDIVSSLEGSSSARDAMAAQALVEVSWSRMAVQNQGMMFDALRLSQMLRDQIDVLQRTNVILSFALLGIVGAYFLTTYLVIYRRMLRSIADLQAGTTIIGAGNLDYAIVVRHEDEIGQLARAFNRMTANLKGITASKAELEREIVERQKAEAEIRRLNESLAQRAAELEASNKELDAFAYSVSHDLRAPLRGIDGFSVALLEDCSAQLDDDGQRYLGMLRQNAQRMGQLIDDLLAFSRLGRQALRLQAVRPRDILQRVWEDLRPEWADRQVDLRRSDLPTCQADPALLRQVYANLLGNALKFSRTRAPAIIEVGYQTQADGEAVYYVRDNGVGFDMQYVDKLFGVFQRLHRAEDYEGTGVGLANVQRIIHLHGGRVWAEGEVEKGSDFLFYIGRWRW